MTLLLAERHTVILALAELARSRPDMGDSIKRIAIAVEEDDARGLFDAFATVLACPDPPHRGGR